MLGQHDAEPMSQEGVALYKSLQDALHVWVVNFGCLKDFSLSPIEFSANFMGTFPKFIVGVRYFIYTELRLNVQNTNPCMTFSG